MPVKKVKIQTKPKLKVSKVAVKKAKVSAIKKSELSPRVKGLNADVFDLKGKVVGKIELPKEVFGAKVNKPLIAQAVRIYLINQRQGTSSTKTRGEVEGSTRKIYRQKGTGRARHGGIRPPLFVGGGIAFGPKPRNHEKAFPTIMKKAALYSALSSKLEAGEIKVVNGFANIEPKTKIMAVAIKNLADGAKRVVVITPSNIVSIQRASKNLQMLKTLNQNSMNVYEVLNNSMLIFMKEAIEGIKKGLTE